MKFLKILLLVSIVTLIGCSNSKKKKAAAKTTEVIQEDADFIVDADDEELIVEDGTGSDEITISEIEDSSESVASAPLIEETSGEIGEYTVKRNETLMMIAFNIYGDYRQWQSLREQNSLSSTNLREGMILKYNKPSSVFSWNPEGLPYLIKRGDSLVTISDDKYGTTSKWRYIYNNNKPLIHDPNLIFAGFTIYYIPARDLASE